MATAKKLSPRLHNLLTNLGPEESKKTGSAELLPEHILLALLKTADGLGYAVLQRLRINILTFRLALEQSIPVHISESSPDEVIFSNRVKKILDNAAIESQSFRHNYLGTEHFILACAAEEGSITWQYLKKAGITYGETKQAVADTTMKFQSSAFEQNHDQTNNNSGSEKRALAHAGIPSSKGPFGRGPGGRKDASILNEFSRDLTALALKGGIDPVVGRENEIQRVMQILSRRTKNNPVLIGDPGVGKTAIAEGLALRIAENSVPSNLVDKRILVLDLALIIAGTKYRGEFEERIKRILKEIREIKNVILFIDEIHTLIGAGGAEGSMDAANMLKPALARGELQCIGATTITEYRKYFERDKALERRFQIVQVKEPTEAETVQILQGIKNKYEEYHGVRYADEVITDAVRFSKRYINERFLPDKAIDVLDEAGAMKKIEKTERPGELTELERKLDLAVNEKNILVQEQNYEEAAHVRDNIAALKRQIDEKRKSWIQNESKSVKKVQVKDLLCVIETMTGIPLEQLDQAESEKLINLESVIHKTVIGQADAVRVIASAIRRSRAGISSEKRPLGSFIFLGPTGVGKTQLAKTIAKTLFGTEDSLIRIDMSDFMEKHNASRLTGAPPGYVGYEEGGMLTEKIRRKPYSVILLDEIEKAHSDVFNLLLQILEEGEIQDNLGHTVNFRNALIIMTSNAGVRDIVQSSRLGFSKNAKGEISYAEIKTNATTELKKIMSPELLNRIDETIVFTPLSKEEIAQIVELAVAELEARLLEKDIELAVTKGAKEYLAEHGYDVSLGARPLRRLVQKEIEDPVSLAVLQGKAPAFSKITINAKDGALTFSYRKSRIQQLLPNIAEAALPEPEAEETSLIV